MVIAAICSLLLALSVFFFGVLCGFFWAAEKREQFDMMIENERYNERHAHDGDRQ